MGAFNTGKSTLLNAMLRQNLLSTNSLPETATVTMLRKGPEGNVFVHIEDTPVQTWPRSKLVALSSENNPELAQIRNNLSFIEVPLKHPLLDKVTLVDTPGIDSLYEAHTKATEEFSRRSDAVLWVISSLMPLNHQEEKWINQLPKSVKVMVVINQVDLLDTDETPLPRLVENVRNKILRDDVFVTAVSAQLALEGMLRSDGNVLVASLWRSFLGDCEREIFVADTDARLRRAYSSIHHLVDSLHSTLSEQHRIADQYRLKAKGGETYHASLEAKIRELVEAERALAPATDAQSTVTLLDIKTYWEDSRELEAQRQILTETLRTIESSEASINDKLIACEQRRKNLYAAQKQFTSDWDAYMKSGLFGGEPVLFKGKKDGLLFRKESLNERFVALQQDKSALKEKQSALRATYYRAQTDCADFIGSVQASLRKTMNSIVNESRNTVDEGIKAAGHLANYEWLQDFARRVRDTDVWSLVDEANNETFLKHAASGTLSSLEKLKDTVESISSQEWHITIRKPILPPALIAKPTVPKNTTPTFKAVESGMGRGFRSLLGLIGVLLTIAIVYLTWQYRDLKTIPAQSSTQSAPAIPIAPVRAPVATDASLIASKLNSDGLSINGNMLDVPDAASGSTLHVVSTVCFTYNPTCHQFFVFLGSEAVWNEQIEADTSVQLVSSSEPDRFSMILTSLGTDGLQQRATVNYAWDGKIISRTVEGQGTQDPSEGTSSALQPGTSSQVPVTPQSMPAAISQSGTSTQAPQNQAAPSYQLPVAAETHQSSQENTQTASGPQGRVALSPRLPPRRTDLELYTDIKRAFAPIDSLKNVRVGYPQQQEVFLSGYVPNEAAKELAQNTARRVEGVFVVHNAIVISQDVQPQRDTYPTPHSERAASPEVAPDMRQGGHVDPDVSGMYAGRITNLTSNISTAFGVLARENSDSFQGCMAVRAPLYGSGPLSGSRHGSSVDFYVTSPVGRLEFNGTISGEKISGTYTISASGQSGQFSLHKVRDLPSGPLGRCATDEENNRAH
jgi:small GTP-binding protein